MKWQNGFVVKLTKMCDSWQHFDIVVSESHDRGVSYAHNMWLSILLFYFCIFLIVSNLLIPMKNFYHNHLSSLLVLKRGGTKNCHHRSNDNGLSHPSWWQFLLQLAILTVAAAPVGAPMQQCWLVCLLSGWAGGNLASSACHFAVQTMIK